MAGPHFISEQPSGATPSTKGIQSIKPMQIEVERRAAQLAGLSQAEFNVNIAAWEPCRFIQEEELRHDCKTQD
jgi:hypothetical protein